MRTAQLLVILAVLLGLASAQFPDCAPAINLTERCNRTVSCQVCDRNDYSFDWLCCEDYGGRPAGYFATAFLMQMYFKNPVWTFSTIVFYEFLEKIYVQRYFDSFLDYESVMGTLAGDLLQGLGGMWFSALLSICFGLPALIPTWKRAHRVGETGMRMVLIAVAMLHILSVVWLLWIGSTYNWGLIGHACTMVAMMWLLNPFVLYTGRQDQLVWSDKKGNIIIEAGRRQAYFFVAGGALVAVEFMNFGWEFMANDWFQSWVVIMPLLGLSALISIGLLIRDHYYSVALQTFGFLLVMLAITLYYIGGALVQDNYHIGALVLAVVGVVLVLGSEQWDVERGVAHLKRGSSHHMEEMPVRSGFA
jgi:hypothetical protein